VLVSAAPLTLATDGYIILTEVLRDAAGNLKVKSQLVAGGLPHASRIGQGVGNPATLPPTPVAIPPNGQTLFAAEVFYRSEPITPIGGLLDTAIGDILYDVAYF
jgi:hypothetical protein